MAKMNLDNLFYKNIRAFELGKCFVCNNSCDLDSYCHYECASAITKEREKRCKEAWEKALAEVKP